MTTPATPAAPEPIPADVVEKFEAIISAAGVAGRLGVVRIRTQVYPYEHFLLGVYIDGSHMIPMGIIPHGKTVMEYIQQLETLMARGGGPELDPDYKGVRM